MTFSEFIINDEIIFDANMSELRALQDGGETIPLNGPTARCLHLLITSEGRIISREEFLDSVWKTRGIVVAQNTFYQNISLLRKSLSRAGLSQDIIVTVRQRGFILASGTVITPVLQSEELVSGTHPEVSLIDALSIDETPNKIISKNSVYSKNEINFKLPVWFVIVFIVMAAINITALLFFKFY